MNTSVVCRTCLNTDSLNPMFLNCDDNLRYSATVFTVTGCKISEGDGLPQWMCIRCINFINKSIRFRKKCMEAQEYLIDWLGKIEISNICSDLQENGTKFDNAQVYKRNLVKSEKALENNVKYELKTEIEETTETDLGKTQQQTEIVYDAKSIEDDDDEKPLKYFLEPDTENSSDGNSGTQYLVIDNNLSMDTEIESKPEKQKQKFKKHPPLENVKDAEAPYEIDLLSGSKTPRVICKICYRSLSIRSIDAHMAMRHPGKDHRKVRCDMCDKYLLKDKLKRHKMMMHSMSAPQANSFKCSYCKTEFENKQGLLDHVSFCSAKKKKRPINENNREMTDCDVCGKSMQKGSLRMHKMIKHAGLGPVCEHCGKRFGSKLRLDGHYRAKHGYDKFQCGHCDFESASVLAMRNHERRHRGEKPFVCDACGAKFHAAYLLTQHKQSHRTERLIKCDQCSATFKANNSLHMHKATCHSASTYACTMCARTYSCRHYVVKHLRHFHQYRGAVGPIPRQDMPRRIVDVNSSVEQE